MAKETYTIRVCDAGDHNNVPLMPRLRRLLKAMLRGYGIRCLAVCPGEASTQPTDSKQDRGESLLE